MLFTRQSVDFYRGYVSGESRLPSSGSDWSWLLPTDPNDNSMLVILIGYSCIKIRVLLLLLLVRNIVSKPTYCFPCSFPGPFESSQSSNVTSTSENGEAGRPRMPTVKTQKNSKRDCARLETSEMRKWSVRDVAEFIRSIGLVEHAMSFEEQVC